MENVRAAQICWNLSINTVITCLPSSLTVSGPLTDESVYVLRLRLCHNEAVKPCGQSRHWKDVIDSSLAKAFGQRTRGWAPDV